MAAFYSRVVVYLGLIGLLGVSLLGCGDAKVSTNVDQSRNDDDGSAPRLGDEYFLVPAGETRLVGNVTEAVGLKAFLYSKKTGDPVPNQAVAYEILPDPQAEPDAEPLATLSAYNGTTDAEGAASIDLRLGAQPGLVTVRVEHELSNAVDFEVGIEALETGDLELTLVNTSPGIMPLHDIDVRLYRNGDFRCADFRPYVTREIGDLGVKVVPSVNEKAIFDNLGTRQRFMVTAVALGDAGQIASAGCAEDIAIHADEVTEREILLQLIPLNPVGQYNVTSHWDFSQAVEDSGSAGSTIMDVLNIFENPGQALYDGVIDLLQQFLGIGGTALDAFLNVTNLDQQFVGLVNDFVENNDQLRRIRDAGRDLRDVVANLEVHSVLTIGKMSSNYEFRGTDNWLGITMYWRWNCDANSPPDCGAINLQADADGRFGELGILSSEWTGRVVAYNQLQIDRHPITLEYGRLMMFLLNDVILPEMTDGNAHSMSEAFSYWVCGGVGTAVTGSDGEICVDIEVWDGCVYDDDIAGFCETASGAVFGIADLLVSNLEYDMGFDVAGEGVLVETTSDGVVDKIRDGIFEGTMQNEDIGQTSASPVSATWEAVRISNETGGL